MILNKLVVKAGIVCALAGAALLSPPATRQASAASTCGICIGGSVCPVDLEEYDYQCSACAFGSYAGACGEGEYPECGPGYHAFVACYYAA